MNRSFVSSPTSRNRHPMRRRSPAVPRWSPGPNWSGVPPPWRTPISGWVFSRVTSSPSGCRTRWSSSRPKSQCGSSVPPHNRCPGGCRWPNVGRSSSWPTRRSWSESIRPIIRIEFVSQQDSSPRPKTTPRDPYPRWCRRPGRHPRREAAPADRRSSWPPAPRPSPALLRERSWACSRETLSSSPDRCITMRR